MSVVEPGAASAGLIARVKGILLAPGATWDIIDREPATIGGIYRGYVIPLAAIPAVSAFIGLLLFGVGIPGLVSFRPSPIWLAAQMVVSYVLALAMCYILALVIEALAPNFGGVKDRTQAFKVAAYASTAAWVAGVFSIVPMIAIIGVLGGIYSLFLLYQGLPKLMKTPEDKALPYTALVVVVAIVVNLIVGVVTSSVLTMSGAMSAAAIGSASVKLPGGEGSVDLGKLQEASKRIEAAGKAIESGQAGPVTDSEVLKGYLPASVAGYARGEVSASTGGVAGMEGSQAEADYAKGDATLKLKVTDVGQVGALASLAGAVNAKSSKETSTGYEKMGVVNGRMTTERYDREARSGEYSVLVGERFMVEASGNGVTMDELKSAVDAVGLSRLEAAAKAAS